MSESPRRTHRRQMTGHAEPYETGPAPGVTPLQLSGLLTWVREHGLQYREIGVSGQDRILALSTCSEASTNARTILMGRLEPFYDDEGGD